MAKDNGKSKTMELADKKLQVTKELTKEEKLKEKKRRKDLRNVVTHKLRFDVLNRDGNTCRYCGCKIGDKMANEEDCKLVVDHVIPLDKGGNNDMDNLVTACWVCNEGKKNTMLIKHGFEREYNLNKEKVIAVAETSNFEEFAKFLVAESNEEERAYLYDLYKQKDEQRCIRDCFTCVPSGKFFYKSCLQKLYHKAKFDLDDRIGLPRDSLTKELIVNSPANSLLCDFCYVSRRCEKYELGAKCGFIFTFNNDKDKTPEEKMDEAIGVQLERCFRGAFFEKVDGGAIDKNLSSELALFASLIKAKKDLSKSKGKIVIEAEVEGDKGGDIFAGLSDLLKGGKEKKAEEVASTEAEYKDVSEKESKN